MKIPQAAQELLKEQGISVKSTGKVPDDVRALLQQTPRDGKAATFHRVEGGGGGGSVNRADFREETERALQKELARTGRAPPPKEPAGDVALLEKLKNALGAEAFNKLVGALEEVPINAAPTAVSTSGEDLPRVPENALVTTGEVQCSCGQALGSDFLFCPHCGKKQPPVIMEKLGAGSEDYPLTPEDLFFQLLSRLGEVPSSSMLLQAFSLLLQLERGSIPNMLPAEGRWGVEWDEGVPCLVAPDGELLGSEEEIADYQKFSEKFSGFS